MTAGRKIISESQEWCTPPKYVEAVQEFFGEIQLDPCSNEKSTVNAKVEFRLPKTDGLVAKWDAKTIYVNPPYGIDRIRKTSIANWIEKCSVTNEQQGSEILALIPVAVNTRHWKKWIFPKAAAVCFLADTRLKFTNGANDKGAPMACAMVYWGNKYENFYELFSKYGAVVDLRNLKKRGWVSPEFVEQEESLF